VTVYNLRNGLSIDLKFDKPTVLTPGPASIDDKDKRSVYEHRLVARPLPIDDFDRPIPSTNVLKMNATGTLSGASDEVFKQCSLRFIQVIQVNFFEVQYFGKQRDEGSITWSWKGKLLERNIDCWINPAGAGDSSPFQFGPEQSEHLAPNKLVAKLGDTPGARIPLLEHNSVSKRDNYLRIFNDRRSFESIVTFVHPDKSMQMLESWKWSFTRAVALKWVKLHAAFDGSNQVVFTPAPSSAPVFGKDADFAGTLASGRIANRLSNEAMDNIRTSANVSYSASDESNIRPPERFWSP
jgi:hypothetical protein